MKNHQGGCGCGSSSSSSSRKCKGCSSGSCRACSGSNSNCCSPLGLLSIDVADRTEILLTTADLVNPFNKAPYRAVRFTGSNANGVRAVFPKPANNNRAYEIIVENLTDAEDNQLVIVSTDPVLLSAFNLQSFGGTEQSLEQEVQNAAVATHTYRTDAIFTVEGAYRVPGFTLTLSPG